jgi:glutamate decarboxylase
MALSKHIDPDELIAKLSEHPHHRHRAHNRTAVSNQTPYSTRYNAQTEISKYKIPHDGAPAEAVHQMLKDELDLDGRPNLNLASFVGTYMEKEAEQLMIENLSKNMSDADEYPAMMAMQTRCISIIATLWGSKRPEKAIGSATTGSSEAIHLGGLAMKRRWQEKRQAAGKDTSKPNILMGANAQVALEVSAILQDLNDLLARIAETNIESRNSRDISRLKPEFCPCQKSQTIA